MRRVVAAAKRLLEKGPADTEVIATPAATYWLEILEPMPRMKRVASLSYDIADDRDDLSLKEKGQQDEKTNSSTMGSCVSPTWLNIHYLRQKDCKRL